MNEEVQKKAMEMLEALAEKLGTTLEHLWEVLLLQAKVEAVEVGIWLLIGTAALTIGGRLFIKNMTCWETGDDHEFARWMTGMGLSIVGYIATLTNLFRLPTLLINPEWWAIREILRLLG
jgi:hypothetical protein